VNFWDVTRSPLVLGIRLRGRLIDNPSAKALVSYFSCTFYFPWLPSLMLGICLVSTLVIRICCSKWESHFAYKGQGSVIVKIRPRAKLPSGSSRFESEIQSGQHKPMQIWCLGGLAPLLAYHVVMFRKIIKKIMYVVVYIKLSIVATIQLKFILGLKLK
jgi:hypothetical protein